MVAHPITGEKTWFNQIMQHHPDVLGDGMRKDFVKLFKDEGCFPRNVLFGDEEMISSEVVSKKNNKALNDSSVNILAKHGDVIFNDSVLVSHSRLPYEGDREVRVALGESYRSSQLKIEAINKYPNSELRSERIVILDRLRNKYEEQDARLEI